MRGPIQELGGTTLPQKGLGGYEGRWDSVKVILISHLISTQNAPLFYTVKIFVRSNFLLLEHLAVEKQV